MADSTPGRLDPQPTNEELVDKAKESDESFTIRRSRDFLDDREGKLDQESGSPIRLLSKQKHGGPHGGFYHDHCRNDPITSFKLWHMRYRTKSRDFPAQHPCEKYRAQERRVFEAMARMDPVYMGRKSKNDIVFRAGDLRRLLEKSSDAGIRVGNVHKKLYEKLLSEGGTQNELQNAMLHYFLACKITAEEAGDLVLEDERAYHETNTNIMLDGPPLYTSKEALSILTVNLGNFVRGRKKTVPDKFAAHVDRKDNNGVGPLVKSLARSQSHIACVLEANNIDVEEVAYLVRHGWCVQPNKGRDIMIMTRANHCMESIEHLAGPRCDPDVHQYLPLSYWVVEIRYGKCPTAAAIRKTGSNLQDRYVTTETTWKRISNAAECQCSGYASFTCLLRLPPKSLHSCMKLWVSCWRIASTSRSTTSPAMPICQPIAPAARDKDPQAFVTRVSRRWSGTISRPITRHRTGILTAVLRLSSPHQTRSRCSGGWRTSSVSPGKTWVRLTGRTFLASTAWSLASSSGHTASQWRFGPRPQILSTSTRSKSPNGCFTATGTSTCFRRPTTTLTLLSSFI